MWITNDREPALSYVKGREEGEKKSRLLDVAIKGGFPKDSDAVIELALSLSDENSRNFQIQRMMSNLASWASAVMKKVLLDLPTSVALGKLSSKLEGYYCLCLERGPFKERGTF